MTPPDDASLDHTDEQDEPAMARVLAQLDRAYAATPPPHLAASMDRAIGAHLAALRPPTPAPVLSGMPGLRRRLSLTRTRLLQTAAVALVAAAIAGSLSLGSQPASAQAILSRAAAFRLAPDQVAHLIYHVTLVGGQKGSMTGTADVWLQADAAGVPVLSAQTLVAGPSAKGLRPVGMVSRYVQDGQQVYAYDSSHNAILLGPSARDAAGWIVPPEIFSGVSVAQDLRAIAALSPQRVQALPPQTIDGRQVDVIQVTGWANRPAQQTTFYFDSQSYVLRGFDIASTDPSYPIPTWQARLTADDTLAASAVPPHTFTLNAPVGARAEFRGGPSLASFAAACHATSVTKGQFQSGQQTPLAICQATAPSMTADALVAALIAPLIAPEQAQLDAAVAAGQVTPAQEADSLALVRAQLAAWIASPGGAGR
jgi:hypothetical protein